MDRLLSTAGGVRKTDAVGTDSIFEIEVEFFRFFKDWRALELTAGR